jgi:hypothetical protein
VSLPALPDEVELGPVSANHHVLAPEGGQPVGAIVRVVLSADPEEPSVQQSNRTGEHPFAGVAAPLEVGVDTSAQGRQRFGEALDAFELLPVPLAAPLRVVEVLTPSRVVGSGRLQMTTIVGADPDVGPRRRDRQGSQSLETLVADRIAALVEVDGSPSVPAMGEAGGALSDATQPGHGRSDAQPRGRTNAVRAIDQPVIRRASAVYTLDPQATVARSGSPA